MFSIARLARPEAFAFVGTNSFILHVHFETDSSGFNSASVSVWAQRDNAVTLQAAVPTGEMRTAMLLHRNHL